MTSQAPTIPRYRLAPPTEDDALAMLARVLGVDQAAATWLRACEEAGVRRTDAGLSPAELARVSETLAKAPGSTGVIGTSLGVRARTWLLLNRGGA
jgi:hypothetical protein